MNSVCFLIKVASELCNLKCDYCFYKDGLNQRSSKGAVMSDETMEVLIANIFKEDYKNITFAFQGGEPTIVGASYFEKFIRLVQDYNKNSVNVLYSIQTNGYDLSEDFIKLFKKYNFLVGVSLDGHKGTNDYSRKSLNGCSTFKRVMENIKKLEKSGVEFNILSVVTSKNYRNIEKNYEFFKKQNFRYLQFIPCMKTEQTTDLSMNNSQYFRYLDSLFNLYSNDFFRDNYMSVRDFDNYVQILLKNPVESCAMSGVCGVYFVIESNGDVYPCDFFAFDDYKIANIKDMSFSQMLKSKKLNIFIDESTKISEQCKKCKYLYLCRAGCKKQRIKNNAQSIARHRYCEAYYKFFEKNEKNLIKIAKSLS